MGGDGNVIKRPQNVESFLVAQNLVDLALSLPQDPFFMTDYSDNAGIVSRKLKSMDLVKVAKRERYKRLWTVTESHRHWIKWRDER